MLKDKGHVFGCGFDGIVTMDLRKQFEEALRKLPEINVDLWKDTDLMCVFFRGKEFAHFHDHEEIDIRLSQKFIRKEGLSPLEGSPYHVGRSKKSRWMQMRFQSEKDVEGLVSLIERLIEDEYKGGRWGTKS